MNDNPNKKLWECIKDMDCNECKEHSAVEAKLEFGEKAMDRFLVFMDDQTKRSYQILVGIIFCLLTGMVSIYVGYDKSDRQQKQSYKNISEKETVGVGVLNNIKSKIKVPK